MKNSLLRQLLAPLFTPLLALLLAFAWPLPLQAQSVRLETQPSPAWSRLQQHAQALALTSSWSGPQQPLRILHLGDSLTVAHPFSGRLRELLVRRFGDGGAGLLPPGELPGATAAPLPLRQSPGWVVTQDMKPGPGAGLGGYAAYSQRPYQFLGYTLPQGNPDARLILYTEPEKTSQPPRYRVFLDNREIPPLTRSAKGRSFFMLPAGQGQLEILSGSGGPAPRLRALSLLQEGRGVSYAVIALKGAGFGQLLEWQGETVRMQMADYQPELLIIAFGTNDVVAPAFSPEYCARTLKQTETWLREHASQAAVLLLLPPDMLRQDARIQRNLATLREQARVQARKSGWYLWDWSHALRSAGHTSLEAFYGSDGIHLNAAGYNHGANLLFDALNSQF